MKDLVYFGYVGTCEPDGQGGYRGHLVGLDVPHPEYRRKSLEAVRNAHQQAVSSYLKACDAAGRKPVTPPEPFYMTAGRDVAWERDLRRDMDGRCCVRVLAYYSLQATFLRGRDLNQTARTMSAWCLVNPQSFSDNFSVAEAAASALDRYGWHPCPGWDHV